MSRKECRTACRKRSPEQCDRDVVPQQRTCVCVCVVEIHLRKSSLSIFVKRKFPVVGRSLASLYWFHMLGVPFASCSPAFLCSSLLQERKSALELHVAKQASLVSSGRSNSRPLSISHRRTARSNSSPQWPFMAVRRKGWTLPCCRCHLKTRVLAALDGCVCTPRCQRHVVAQVLMG